MPLNRMILCLFLFGCTLLIACAGKSTIEIQQLLITMTDMELTSHYKMLDMRIIDIERDRDQAIEKERDVYGGHYPGDAHNHLGHLHISDHWGALQKEKKLTQREMRKRGLSPPQ